MTDPVLLDAAVQGVCPPAFQPVRNLFEQNLQSGEELGARFTLVRNGEVLLDVWGGWADRKRTRLFDAQTLAPVFSTTKALAALMVARLVDKGALSYEQPVADVWPEFAQAGKGAITVAQAMSHQAGLPGFLEPMDPALWFDWDAICAKLAAMSPMWSPGTASGYHAVTFGFLAGEIFRRVDGRTLGRALREDIAEPLALDLWIGLPASEHGRVAELDKPRGLAKFGPLNDATRAAFLTPWAAPGGRGSAAWREAELPSANGHATAEALARLMAVLAEGDGGVIGADALAQATQERIVGDDLVLPYRISWGAGFIRNAGLNLYGPGENTFGHSGFGGSCAFADPERRIGGAYVMNKQGTALIADPRPTRLIDATYACL